MNTENAIVYMVRAATVVAERIGTTEDITQDSVAIDLYKAADELGAGDSFCEELGYDLMGASGYGPTIREAFVNGNGWEV